ncbi:MAG: cytochrome C, partial [Deferribacteraceae bacterium]|nr:cytochrome C [Deferribacteraceae bacterium]
FQQTEISCTGCHGDGEELPQSGEIDNRTTALRQNYAKSPPADSIPLTTGKGRVLPNAFKQNGGYRLLTKRNGELKEIKTIKGTPEHRVAGHERLDCISCHSKVTFRCYGCHMRYDEREYAVSGVTGEMSRGAFSETEDIRLFYPFPLMVNWFGKITPITRGQQSYFSHIDAEGKVVKGERLLEFSGENQENPKFAPFFGHNLGEKAVSCSECHGNPYFYGFGEGLFSTKDGGEFISPLIDDASGKPLTALYTISSGRLVPAETDSGKRARVFTGEEIKKIMNVNRCIVCHDSPKYFTEKRDYEKVLSDSAHTSLIR